MTLGELKLNTIKSEVFIWKTSKKNGKGRQRKRKKSCSMIRQKLALNSGGMVVSSPFDCSRAPRISNTLRYLSVCLAKLRYLPLDLHHQSSSHMRNQTTEASFRSLFRAEYSQMASSIPCFSLKKQPSLSLDTFSASHREQIHPKCCSNSLQQQSALHWRLSSTLFGPTSTAPPIVSPKVSLSRPPFAMPVVETKLLSKKAHIASN